MHSGLDDLEVQIIDITDRMSPKKRNFFWEQSE